MVAHNNQNWYLIFKYYSKLFSEKDPQKQNVLWKLIKRLQFVEEG